VVLVGSVAAGVGVDGVRIIVEEKGREDMFEMFSSSSDVGRTTGRGDVRGKVLTSGALAEECVEDVEMDARMVITGGIHMSTVVDSH
jgi:hypothetical protein